MRSSPLGANDAIDSMYIMIYELGPVIGVSHTSPDTNAGVYQPSEPVASALGAWYADHDEHATHVMTIMLPQATHVRHTVTSRNVSFITKLTKQP